MAAPMEGGLEPAGGGGDARTGQDEQESPRPEPAFVYTERDFIRSGVRWSGSRAESRLDRALLSAWARRLAAGCFRYPLRGPEMPSRELPGSRRLLAQLNARRASQRRPPQTIAGLRQPFDPQRFNFSRVPAREILFPLRRGGGPEARVGGRPLPEGQPQPQASARPEAQAGGRPLPEGQPQPQAQASARPEAQAGARPLPEGQTQPQPQASARPEAQAGARPLPEGQTQPQAQASARPEAQAGGRPLPEGQPQTQPQASARPEAQPDPDPLPEGQPQTQPQPQASARPEARAQPDPDPLPEGQPQTQPQPQASARPEAQAGGRPLPEGQPQTQPQASARPEARAQPDPDPQPEAESDALLIINVSPLEQGHVLLVPEPEKLLPQTMTRASVLRALELVLLSSDPAFRVGFNSLGAFASVNHLHLHGFYLRHRLEVEWAPTEPLGVTGAGARVHRLCGHYTRALVLYSDGGDCEEVADTLLAIIHLLLDRSVAHNLLLTRGCALGPQPPDPDSRDGVRLILWPRRSCFGAKDGSAFNVAFCELAGFLPVKTAPDFETLTEESALRIIGEQLLPAEEFQQLGAEIAGLSLH